MFTRNVKLSQDRSVWFYDAHIVLSYYLMQKYKFN